MEHIGVFFQLIMALFKIEVDVYGYTISMWQIYLFTLVGGIVLHFIGGFFNGD